MCPHEDGCEVKSLEVEFREGCNAELAPGTLQRWTLDVLLRDLAVVWNASAAAGEHSTEAHWTVRTARLVSIVRQEQASARRVDDWNRRQELKG